MAVGLDLRGRLQSISNTVQGVRPNFLPQVQSMLAARPAGSILGNIRQRLGGIGEGKMMQMAMSAVPARGEALTATRFSQPVSGYRAPQGQGPISVDPESGFRLNQ